jgi:hypothetical protein
MKTNKQPELQAFQSAVRLAAGLSLKALNDAGWSLEELLTAMDAVHGVEIEPEDEERMKVTVSTDPDNVVDKDLLERMADEGDLPLFLWMVSASVTEPALA